MNSIVRCCSCKSLLQQAQQKHWYYQKIETTELLIYTEKFEISDQIEMMLVLKDALKDSSTMRLGCNEGGKFPGPQFAVGSVEK